MLTKDTRRGMSLSPFFNFLIFFSLYRHITKREIGILIVSCETAHDIRLPLDVTGAGVRPTLNYILGGMEVLVQVFEKFIVAHGGQIHTNSPVDNLPKMGSISLLISFTLS